MTQHKPDPILCDCGREIPRDKAYRILENITGELVCSVCGARFSTERMAARIDVAAQGQLRREAAERQAKMEDEIKKARTWQAKRPERQARNQQRNEEEDAARRASAGAGAGQQGHGFRSRPHPGYSSTSGFSFEGFQQRLKDYFEGTGPFAGGGPDPEPEPTGVGLHATRPSDWAAIGLVGGTQDEATARGYYRKAMRETHPDLAPPEKREEMTRKNAFLNAAWDRITKGMGW